MILDDPPDDVPAFRSRIEIRDSTDGSLDIETIITRVADAVVERLTAIITPTFTPTHDGMVRTPAYVWCDTHGECHRAHPDVYLH